MGRKPKLVLVKTQGALPVEEKQRKARQDKQNAPRQVLGQKTGHKAGGSAQARAKAARFVPATYGEDDAHPPAAAGEGTQYQQRCAKKAKAWQESSGSRRQLFIDCAPRIFANFQSSADQQFDGIQLAADAALQRHWEEHQCALKPAVFELGENCSSREVAYYGIGVSGMLRVNTYKCACGHSLCAAAESCGCIPNSPVMDSGWFDMRLCHLASAFSTREGVGATGALSMCMMLHSRLHAQKPFERCTLWALLYITLMYAVCCLPPQASATPWRVWWTGPLQGALPALPPSRQPHP